MLSSSQSLQQQQQQQQQEGRAAFNNIQGHRSRDSINRYLFLWRHSCKGQRLEHVKQDIDPFAGEVARAGSQITNSLHYVTQMVESWRGPSWAGLIKRLFFSWLMIPWGWVRRMAGDCSSCQLFAWFQRLGNKGVTDGLRDAMVIRHWIEGYLVMLSYPSSLRFHL